MASIQVVKYLDDEEEKRAKAKQKAAKKKLVNRDAPRKRKGTLQLLFLWGIVLLGFCFI